MLVSFLQNPFQDIRPLASLPSPVGVRSLQIKPVYSRKTIEK